MPKDKLNHPFRRLDVHNCLSLLSLLSLHGHMQFCPPPKKKKKILLLKKERNKQTNNKQTKKQQQQQQQKTRLIVLQTSVRVLMF